MDQILDSISRQSNVLVNDYQVLKKNKEATMKSLKSHDAEVDKLRQTKSKLTDELMQLKNKNDAMKLDLDAKTKQLNSLKKRSENARKELEGFKQVLH